MSEQRAGAKLYSANAPEPLQRRALTGGRISVSVYGLGKMGLPLAAVYADVTGNVTGVDIDEEVVDAVSAGRCPVEGEPGLPEEVSVLADRGALTATTNGVEAAADAAVHVVIVPTLVEDDRPDLSSFEAAIRSIGAGLDAGDTVIVESTVPPRTCRDRVIPWLEAESGLSADEFGVAFCPERTMSGRALADIRGAHPKVLGGADPESARVARLIYGEITDAELRTVADCATAECVKVFEGVYRDVNIALANELATMADEVGVDVTAAIEAANSQPYCDIHSPGPGVGGHCIPYYPYFLTAEFETPNPLLETAREVNDGMPAFTVEKLAAELAENGRSLAESSVLVLGLTYRPGVDEVRASPGVAVAEMLADRAGTVYATDPVCSTAPPDDVVDLPLDSVTDRSVDAVVLTTAHGAFEDIDWSAFEDLVIVDGRRALRPERIPHSVYTIGGGSRNSPDRSGTPHPN